MQLYQQTLKYTMPPQLLQGQVIKVHTCLHNPHSLRARPEETHQSKVKPT